jgi:esterase/lipase superfamily enzyme
VKKRIYIFVNGIMTFPGESDNWNAKAVTHFIVSKLTPAEKLEYFSGFLLSRAIWQKKRAEKLRKKLQFYINQGWEICLVAHSNGADVVLDTLRDMNWPAMKELHLFSPACESDFVKNGLNGAMADGRIDKVSVYIAEKDLPLRLAGTLIGWISGFGQLGRTGPMRVCEDVSSRVRVVRESDFGHSTWWSEENFAETMDRIAV